MEFKKKYAALFLTAALAVSMSACGASGDENAGADSAQTEEQGGGGSASSEGSAGSADNGAAKGRMQALAEMIQTETGGDLFSIRTEETYPADGGDLIDYAADEQDEDARSALSTHIENLDNYDTIFIGYPKMEYSL